VPPPAPPAPPVETSFKVVGVSNAGVHVSGAGGSLELVRGDAIILRGQSFDQYGNSMAVVKLSASLENNTDRVKVSTAADGSVSIQAVAPTRNTPAASILIQAQLQNGA